MGRLVKGLAPDGKPRNPSTLVQLLQQYAALLKPWAQQVAETMLQDVGSRTARQWRKMDEELGRELRNELQGAPTGEATRQLMQSQVDLITSLPTEAAERVHRLVLQGMVESTRASDIAKEILRTEDVTAARARLIARTEVARASSVLTQARAEYAGSEGYIWRTSGDADVRESHAEMEGRYVRWSEPPLLSDGTRTHAGQIYNCRCYAEPVFPERNHERRRSRSTV